MHAFKFPTLTTMHEKLCERMLYASREHVDNFSSMETELLHVVAQAESMAYDYELRRFWVPVSRWGTMVRQYIDPEAFLQWTSLIEHRFGNNKKRGAAVLRTNLVASRVGGKGTVRNLGSCMLSLSFSLRPRPVITLHSRTCYLGYLSVLDLSVAYVAAKYVAQVLGIDVREIGFVWFAESLQVHGFRTIAFPLGDSDEYDRFLSRPHTPDFPAMHNSHKHHSKYVQQDAEGLLYSGMPFTSYRRLRKRWHSEMFGFEHADKFSDLTTGKSDHRAYRELPDTHVDDLDFSAIGITL